MVAVVSPRASSTCRLQWQALVDWAGDGVWGATTADVSHDLMAVRWRWGRARLPLPEFAPPAVVELTLQNRHGRYTPDNPDSSLLGLVEPGREVWLRAAWPHDDFSTPSGNPQSLDGRQALPAGGSWEELTAGGNGFLVDDGKVRGLIGRGRPTDAVATLDAGSVSATLIGRFRRASDGLGGFVLRCAAQDDCVRLRFYDASTVLERISGRTVTSLASGKALDLSTWYELEVIQSDHSLAVYATRLDAAGTVRSVILSAAGLADLPNSGRHGLWHGFRNTSDLWGAFGLGRSLFCGRITSIQPDHESAVCRITAADFSQHLDDIRLFRGLAGGSMYSGAVAAVILGWAGLSPSDYVVGTGDLMLTGPPRSVWGVTAGRALRQLQREGAGLLFVDGLGRIHMEGSAARQNVRSLTDPATVAVASLSDVSGGIDPYVNGARWDDGSAAVEKEVTFRYRRSVDHGRQQVWSLGEPMLVPPGDERLVLAATEDWDCVVDFETPAADTDYQATDDAAGDGADLTMDVTVEVLAEAESGISGRGAMLRVSNTGTVTAYVQRLDLHAGHCWRPASATAYTRNANDAVTGLGPSRVVECRYIDHYAGARVGADSRFAGRSRRREQVEVSMPLVTGINLRAALEGRLSDVVSVQASAHGLSGAWFVEGLELSAHAGRLATARWWLSEV